MIDYKERLERPQNDNYLFGELPKPVEEEVIQSLNEMPRLSREHIEQATVFLKKIRLIYVT